MAYAPPRSMNAELRTGAVEGRYKQVVKDRGGFPERATYDERDDLHDMWYGIHEVEQKQAPGFDAPVRTQAYRETPRPEPWH